MDNEPLETLCLVPLRRQPSFQPKNSHSSCLDPLAFSCKVEKPSPWASWIETFVQKFGSLQRQLRNQIRIQILSPYPFFSNSAYFELVA